VSDPYVRVPTPKWHPLEDARPHGVDELLCVDEWMGEWAIIRILTFGEETWYRAVTPQSDPAARELVGYSQDLKTLAKYAYLRFLHRRENASGPINGWDAQRRAAG
jgi:hypothetical protein